nr:NAD(P)H-binding protein [Frankia gtarii]
MSQTAPPRERFPRERPGRYADRGFGANGPTGRLVVQQALEAGHEIVAVTRRPAEFPLAGERLTVIGADVADARSNPTRTAMADSCSTGSCSRCSRARSAAAPTRTCGPWSRSCATAA